MNRLALRRGFNGAAIIDRGNDADRHRPQSECSYSFNGAAIVRSRKSANASWRCQMTASRFNGAAIDSIAEMR